MKHAYCRFLFIQVCAVFCGLFLCLGNVFGNETTEEGVDFFSDIIITPDLHFTAEYLPESKEVSLQWAEWRDDVMWYKVVRSQSNPNPSYPEDGYIHYSSSASETVYSDVNPPMGKTFYRVCAITHSRERFCSNTITVVMNDTQGDETGYAFCLQVITPAVSEETGQCQEFPTPCDVPDGWNTVSFCDTDEDVFQEKKEDISSEEEEEDDTKTDTVRKDALEKEFMFSAQYQESGNILLLWEGYGDEKEVVSGVFLFRGREEGSLSPLSFREKSFGSYEDTTVKPGEYWYRARFLGEEGEEISSSKTLKVLVPEQKKKPIVFSDIPEEAIGVEKRRAIQEYAQKGVVSGFGDGTFRPEKEITRAEIAKVLIQATESEYSAASKDNFCDVPSDSWFAPFVQYFFENNFATGFTGGKCSLNRFFSPHNSVLRSEAVKMILEIYGIPPEEQADTGFVDIPLGHWSTEYVAAARKNGMFTDEENIFRGNVPITRGDVMLYMSRVEEFSMNP